MMAKKRLEGCHIAAKYGVHPNVFRGWLKPHLHHLGPRIGNKWSILQIEIMKNIFGEWDFPEARFIRPARNKKSKSKKK